MGCIESETTRSSPVRANIQPTQSHKRSKSRKMSRMSTKFKLTDLHEITDDERHGGYTPCYACPICFVYYNKILACSQCTNFICFKCFVAYQRKAKQNLKCPFCSSSTSLFVDYELEAHSYFDSSNRGFLSKEERSKIDQEMEPVQRSKLQPTHGSVLEPIAEENH